MGLLGRTYGIHWYPITAANRRAYEIDETARPKAANVAPVQRGSVVFVFLPEVLRVPSKARKSSLTIVSS